MNRLLLECEAARVLLRFADVLEPVTLSHRYRGWVCTIVIEPDPHSIPILTADQIPTQCEADILRVLRDAGKRLLRPEIVRQLDNDHGESTVTRSLARLVKLGKVQHVVRRGYCLPGTPAGEC